MTGGRERDRYGHKDWREQLGDIPAGLRAHPRVSFVAAIVVIGLAIQLLLRPTYVTVLEVAAGDCLYIRAAASEPADPAAEPTIEAFAERAACDASHSHEVLFVQVLGEPGSAYPDDAALREVEAACDAALRSARPRDTADGLVASMIAPTQAAWDAGAVVGVCAVSRVGGGFLDRPLRDLPAGAGATT